MIDGRQRSRMTCRPPAGSCQFDMGGAFGALLAVDRAPAMPLTTKSLMPSLNGPGAFDPIQQPRVGLVAAEQPFRAVSTDSSRSGIRLCHAVTPAGDSSSPGSGMPRRQSQVLRAHRCGRTCRSAALRAAIVDA